MLRPTAPQSTMGLCAVLASGLHRSHPRRRPAYGRRPFDTLSRSLSAVGSRRRALLACSPGRSRSWAGRRWRPRTATRRTRSELLKSVQEEEGQGEQHAAAPLPPPPRRAGGQLPDLSGVRRALSSPHTGGFPERRGRPCATRAATRPLPLRRGFFTLVLSPANPHGAQVSHMLIAQWEGRAAISGYLAVYASTASLRVPVDH